MKKHDLISKYFKRENLVDTMATYQLYYQISLGTYITESSFDEEKVDELGLDILPENVCNTMIEIINNFHKEKDFDDIFNDNIKINAMIHSLKDFTLKNKELEDKENIYDTFYEKILNDSFYTINMNIFFEEEIKIKINDWKDLINKKTARELKESAFKII
ncbi:hypothetical protein [Sulfurimonas sp.]|uniref:hypothetical protein n=1 Tax=Sulfurimonas sp. TaxID=2022749 RepID=UPI0025E1DA54|nr:hypothetical protein [Sulfurimonas sp.]